MIAPQKPEPELDLTDDDLGLDLDLEDREGELDGDQGSFLPEGDEDLELDDAEEVIGLDARTGLDEEGEDEDTLAEDDRSWLDDAASEELAADDEGEDDTERWTEGSEPAGEDGFDDDLLLDDAPAGAAQDSGDEGFADEQVLSGLDVDPLPALGPRTSDEDDGGDPIERELLEELVAAVPEEAASTEATRVPPVWTRLREGAAPVLLAAADDLCAAWDGGMWLSRGEEQALTPVIGLDTVAHALAACAGGGAGHVQLAAATPNGVCVSRDGGRTFGRALQVEEPRAVPAYVAFTHDGGGAVLWAAAPFGKLQVLRAGSEALVEAGLELSVAKLASDGAQSLLVVGKSEDGALRAVISRDAGRSFKPLALPADSVERVQLVAVAGECWLCSRRGLRPQLLWGRRGEAGMPLGANAAPPVALVVERGVPCAYLCEVEGGRAALLRVELTADAKVPHAGKVATMLGQLPADLGTPLQLTASRDAQGATRLYLAGTRALYRVVLAPFATNEG